MSWQATAWAVTRVTGSPKRKLMLLALANYADEFGYCYPSQKTLSDVTEQSHDTVQRQLKRLADDGHIAVEKRERVPGRWPSRAYRLNLCDLTTPQSAARSEREHDSVTQCDASDLTRAQCVSADTQPARPPTRTAMRVEPSREHPLEPLPSSSSSSVLPRGVKRSAEGRKERPEVVHTRIASKLGRGDIASGWMLLSELTDSSREFLTSCERTGTLNDAIIDKHRAHAHAAMRRSTAWVAGRVS